MVSVVSTSHFVSRNIANTLITLSESIIKNQPTLPPTSAPVQPVRTVAPTRTSLHGMLDFPEERTVSRLSASTSSSLSLSFLSPFNCTCIYTKS